ncbi:hypothetical protein RRG08_035684 [Elysia crispata]|uniref:Uncharacterized protein n=1 Tax=Elysia crispata TaxID=231223 RepID=A0AAE0YAH2_9GAST|nr:hypothetical protein RRG08_035684 [Elysia crispata]
MAARFEVDVFDHPDTATRPAFTDDIQLNDFTPEATRGGDTIITPGRSAKTSFITGNVNTYGQPMTPINTLAYVEGEYKDVFDMSLVPFEKKVIADAANDYYRMLAQQQNIAPELPDLSNFMIDEEGRLRLKDYPDINLINESTNNPNELSTVSRCENGRVAIQKKLGIPAWTKKMSKAAKAELLKYIQQLSKADSNIESAPLEDSGQAADEAAKGAEKLLAVFVREGALASGLACEDEFDGICEGA